MRPSPLHLPWRLLLWLQLGRHLTCRSLHGFSPAALPLALLCACLQHPQQRQQQHRQARRPLEAVEAAEGLKMVKTLTQHQGGCCPGMKGR